MEAGNENQKLNTSSQAPLSSPTLSNPISNSRGNLVIILGVVTLLLVAIGVGAYYLGTQKNKSSSYGVQQTVSPTPAIESSPAIDQTVSSPTPRFTVKDTFVKPVNLKINESCIDIGTWSEASGQKIQVRCESLGETSISPFTKILIKPRVKEKVLTRTDYAFDVYLEFYESGVKLNIPSYYLPSFADANISWFTLDVSYLDRNNIYISDDGGHEVYPQHFFFDGKKWTKLSLWDLVKKDFPDTIQPPFSLEVSPKYLKITENNYASDLSYTPNLQDRKDYRLVYLLDRSYGTIVEKTKVLR